MADGQNAPWRSDKVWLAVIGLGALCGLSALDAIPQLDGWQVVVLIGSLILGRAWEGAAAAKNGG